MRLVPHGTFIYTLKPFGMKRNIRCVIFRPNPVNFVTDDKEVFYYVPA